MTQGDFRDLLSRVATLSPEQVRQLRERLDRQQVRPKRRTTGRPERTRPPEQPDRSPVTEAELDQHLLSIGLMSQLPNTAADFDDPADELIEIRGEPLSETIIRERR